MNENIDRKTWQSTKMNLNDADELLKNDSSIFVVDQYQKNLEELFLLRNPKYRFDKNYKVEFEKFFYEQTRNNPDQAGQWFYFPWSKQLVHFLPADMHQELRTGRNRNLITTEEQQKYYESKISVLGMSVGSHVAAAIAMTGGSKNMKLADPDTYSGDNLNRVRTGFGDVGSNKAIIVSRKLHEIDPYANYSIYPDGLNENNLEEILSGSDVIVEEMDNLYWKLKIRELAKARGVPVIMGTDNGDGIIVDIERFDLDKNYPILHGSIGDLTAEKCKTVNPKELPRVYAKVAGAELAVVKMLESVAEVGKTLYSWPQLGTAANLCGTVVAYLSRRIVLNSHNIKSGRYEVNLDSIFESDFGLQEVKTERENKQKKFLDAIGV